MAAEDKKSVDPHDVAFVDAWEQRAQGGKAADVPPAWRPEIEPLLQLRTRWQDQPLPEVPPAVRAVVMAAAVERAAAPTRPTLWAWLGGLLLRPVPILAAAGAIALGVALSLRQAPVSAPPQQSGAVAMLPVEADAAMAAGTDRAVAGQQVQPPPPVHIAPPAAETRAEPPTVPKDAPAIAGRPEATSRGSMAGSDLASSRGHRSTMGGGAAVAVSGAAREQRAEATGQDPAGLPDVDQPIAARPASVAPGSADESLAVAKQMAPLLAAEGEAPARQLSEAAAPPPVARAAVAESRRSAGGSQAADAAASAGAGVSALRKRAEQEVQPAARRSALLRLRAAAERAGDRDQVKWATEQLAVLSGDAGAAKAKASAPPPVPPSPRADAGP